MSQGRLFTSKAPRVSEQDVAWLIDLLDGHGWQTMRDIRALGLAGWDDRRIRAIAAASQGRIISGQCGYARTDQASVEDVQHAVNWMRSQAAQMVRRARQIEQAMHTRSAA